VDEETSIRDQEVKQDNTDQISIYP